jgi:GNAT superfamily N-acetyltransferase
MHTLTYEDADWASKALVAISPWSCLGYSAEGLAKYLRRSDPALKRYTLNSSGCMIGVICIRYPWLLGPYIEVVAVLKPYRRKGVARDIFQWIETEINASSKNMWTAVSSFNDSARNFYTRMGFVEIGPIPDLIKPGCTEILLRKSLIQPHEDIQSLR